MIQTKKQSWTAQINANFDQEMLLQVVGKRSRMNLPFGFTIHGETASYIWLVLVSICQVAAGTTMYNKNIVLWMHWLTWAFWLLLLLAAWTAMLWPKIPSMLVLLHICAESLAYLSCYMMCLVMMVAVFPGVAASPLFEWIYFGAQATELMTKSSSEVVLFLAISFSGYQYFRLGAVAFRTAAAHRLRMATIAL